MEAPLLALLIFMCMLLNYIQGEQVLSNLTDLEAKIDRLTAATAGVAADLKALKDQIGTGMSQAEVDEVAARLEAAAAALEAVDAAQ